MVPTLVMIVKLGGKSTQAWIYLVVYNLMFIVPLIVAFVLTYRGMQAQALLRWSRDNVVLSKVLMGCFFLAMVLVLILVEGLPAR